MHFEINFDLYRYDKMILDQKSILINTATSFLIHKSHFNRSADEQLKGKLIFMKCEESYISLGNTKHFFHP